MTQVPDNVLALDIGSRRIGVAVASLVSRLPRGVETIDRLTTDPIERIKQLASSEVAGVIIAGLPRDMAGNETEQTRLTAEFVAQLRAALEIPVETVDETATSLAAASELASSGKPYAKGDIDMRAAVIILEDWLETNGRGDS
jgi:putative transcription antitermination factor YqgF